MIQLFKKIGIFLTVFLIVACDQSSDYSNQQNNNTNQLSYDDLSKQSAETYLKLLDCQTNLKAETAKNKNIKKMKAEAEKQITTAQAVNTENQDLKQKNQDLIAENKELKEQNKKIEEFANGSLLYKLKNLDFNSKLILGVLSAAIVFFAVFTSFERIQRNRERLLDKGIKEYDTLQARCAEKQELLDSLNTNIVEAKIEFDNIRETLSEAKELINSDVVARNKNILDQGIAKADEYYESKVKEIKVIVAEENAKLKNQWQQVAEVKAAQKEKEEQLTAKEIEVEEARKAVEEL
jgi:hypothetical protein